MSKRVQQNRLLEDKLSVVEPCLLVIRLIQTHAALTTRVPTYVPCSTDSSENFLYLQLLLPRLPKWRPASPSAGADTSSKCDEYFLTGNYVELLCFLVCRPMIAPERNKIRQTRFSNRQCQYFNVNYYELSTHGTLIQTVIIRLETSGGEGLGSRSYPAQTELTRVCVTNSGTQGGKVYCKSRIFRTHSIFVFWTL